MQSRTLPRSRVLERATQHVLELIGQPELNRTYVVDATVEQQGTHYRIAAGADSAQEWDSAWARAQGHCACGGPLSISFRRSYCRRCES